MLQGVPRGGPQGLRFRALGFRASGFRAKRGLLVWVAIKELELSHHNGYTSGSVAVKILHLSDSNGGTILITISTHHGNLIEFP